MENWIKMSLITNKIDLNDKNKMIDCFELKRTGLSKAREDKFLYISYKFDYKFGS